MTKRYSLNKFTPFGRVAGIPRDMQVVRYLVPFLAVAAALLLRKAITGLSGAPLPPFIMLYPAVMIVTLVTGFGPGMVATIAAALAAKYWYLPPRGAFAFDSSADAVALSIFTGLAMLTCLVAELAPRSARQAETEAGELAGSVAAPQHLSALRQGMPLSAGFLLALVILTAVGWLSIRNLNVQIEAEGWTAHTHLVIQQLEGLVSEMKDVENGQRGYVITGNEGFLEPYRRAVLRVPPLISELNRLTAHNPHQQQRIARLTHLIEEKLAITRRNIELYESRGFPAVQANMASGKGKAVMDQIRTLVSEAQAGEETLLQRHGEKRKLSGSATLQGLLTGDVIGFVILSAVFIFLKKENAQRRLSEAELRRQREGLEAAVADRTALLSQEIEEHKQTEAALRESERKFSLLFHEAAVPVALSRLSDQEFVAVNDAWTCLFGFSKEEVIGRNSCELGVDRNPGGRRSAEALRQKGQVLDLERTLYAKSGAEITVLTNVANVTINGERFVLTTLQDITARKKAEEALKNSEERYRCLFEMESDAVLLLDQDSGRFMDVNSAALAIYGYSKEEFLKLRHVDLSAEPALTERAVSGRVANVPLRLHRKKDGTVFPVEIASSYFEIRGRSVNVAAIRDLTERQAAKQHLLELNRKLLALSEHLQTVQERERTAIARDIHDDIGQNITVLKYDLEWIGSRLPDDGGKMRERMEEMRKTINQLNHTVQRIAEDLRPPLLDTMGLVAAIEWHVTEFGKRSGLECFLMVNEGIQPRDQETATAVMRIAQEALTNVARHARATEVGISLCERDGMLVLEISDNGCGASAESLAAPTAWGIIGMHERARICGGELKIGRDDGGGTLLHLSIPLSREERTQ